MKYLYLDIETRAPVDIKQVGLYAYAERAEIILVSAAIDDREVHVASSLDDLPLPVQVALREPTVRVVAHNSMFDRTVLRLRGYEIPAERWEDTMVLALSCGFPAALDDLGAALGLDVDTRKIKAGKQLIRLFCTPSKNEYEWETEYTKRDQWRQFVEYAGRDIIAMRAVHQRLPRWNWTDTERSLWCLDQRINDRGFAVDMELARCGARAAGHEKTRLAERFEDITHEDFRPSQRARYMEWVQSRYGIDIPDTTSDTLKHLYENAAHPDVLRLSAEIVEAYNRTSNKKFDAMIQAVSSDGRFRGGLQYNGAARTRRWAGRFFQPQNLPSRGLPDAATVAAYIPALKAGVHDLLYGDDVMRLGSAAIRGLIVAPEGHRLVISDLSNVEGRVCAWLAGETWKLDAFRAFDNGTGPDLYNLTATSIVGGDPWDVPKATRNAFGKVPELALQFQSGVHGLQTFAAAYHVSFAEHWQTIESRLDPGILDYARQAYHERGTDSGISELEWVASEAVKLAWRNRHPRVKALWGACQEAAANAIETPNQWFRAGPKLRFCAKRKGSDKYLLCALPSGRFLMYYDPQVEQGQITYMGYGDEGRGARSWCRRKMYGGRFVANATQATAGDVFRDALPGIENAGYDPVLLVHDEVVAESQDGSADELSAVLAGGHPWTTGLPLAAAGFETQRYRKE